MNLSKPTDGKLPTKQVWMAGGISILGSVIANLAVYWVGRMVVNPDPGFQPLAGPGPTIFFTVAFLLVAPRWSIWGSTRIQRNRYEFLRSSQ